MDLKDFKFQEISAIDIAFSTLKADPDLLAEAKERGFDDNNPYNDLFAQLFYNGGKVKFKKDVDESFVKKAWPYCQALMHSFEPKHEEKESICAMLMSELLEPELEKKRFI